MLGTQTDALHPQRVGSVYLTIRVLPDACRPGRVVRAPGRTLVAVDARDTRLRITTWMVDNLTVEEQNLYREAFALPPVGDDTDDWITEDAPSLLYVPAALRLRGEGPIQGGCELARRQAAGLLTVELALWRAETGESEAAFA